ncbi:3-hydroxyacyl-CoA dehydrogenase NAD-binding domain-containing protein [Sulfitobacter sp. F26204]|uniref:3-hydroxyacyl-CoA dehydrogenase NAD-binding domain-containing protein n=1 Tax=Sulfitobacter sp. F26204 TaxID=2996014 RepID=UPI00225E4D06|nr:3-hydroxyacyl-CoA dehydrogenase NAD-binding domain-containing protein [Sulfitobacter sp. F26204]MCX7561347.1 3-hydroxyacyl-CoA dehydrogenase NAD-binding domain-containing protein [Sulfitobacter sp. F26204]
MTTKTDVVRIERDGDIAIVLLDNPPVNASTQALRQGLLAAIRTLSADQDIAGVVLMGVGRNFISGSDLKEFSGPLAEPQLPVVISAIEDAPFPVVAAINGAALGGGYELALGCDARIGAADALVGLPEVKLGIIPGAGGTQRLPRLVGVAKSIQLICKGARVKAVEAHKLGMLDAISRDDLRADAITFLRSLNGKKRLLSAAPVPDIYTDQIVVEITKALRGNKSVPAAQAAITSIQRAATEPFDTALAKERTVFQDLRLSPEAYALRHQFFAQRDAKRIPSLTEVSARDVRTVGVIGVGTMGAGIAICFLNAGFHVTIIELAAQALDAGVQRISDGYVGQVKAGRLTQSQADDCMSRLTPTTDRSELVTADLVIEAIVENLSAKQSLFADLETIVPSHAVLATNTSYLDIDGIADAMADPSRLIGMHFFSPADRMRLLEVVSGPRSSATNLATAFAVGRKLGKATVLAKSAEGFIGNRIYAAYRGQCEFMVEEGADPQQVDAALVDFGFALGPFSVSDLSGLDIAKARRDRLAATRDPMARYVDIPDRLCDAGRLGRKTGAGWYDYSQNPRVGVPDPITAKIVKQSRADKGIVARPFTQKEIVDRVMAAIVNEAKLVLQDGIADKASDIDVVMVTGYGFPSYRGGPMYWAQQLPCDELTGLMDQLQTATGHGFFRADA